MNNYTINTPKTWNETLSDLETTFSRWRVKEWGVFPARIDSRKAYWTRAEAKVTVVFTKDGKEQRFTLGTQDRPQDNLRALYLGLESMRLNEVRGIADVVREMYAQLPAPATVRDPYEVLGVRPDASLEDIKDLYRIKAKRLHPDTADPTKVADTEAIKELNAAFEKIQSERSR